MIEAPELTDFAGGKRLWSSANGAFEIWSNDLRNGWTIYSGRPVGRLDGLPMRLRINRCYVQLDRFCPTARRTPDQQARLDQSFRSIFASRGIRRDVAAQRVIVEAARDTWTKGHPLLLALALKCNPINDTGWDPATTREVFGDSFFASSCAFNMLLEASYAEIEQKWQEEGRQLLPWYFERFGVPTAEREHRGRLAASREASLRPRGRRPSAEQTRRIDLMRRALRIVAPVLASILAKRCIAYRITPGRALGGALKEYRYRSRKTVYLARDIVAGPFPRAVAVFIHEHAHVLGHDGSRGFTDALTWILRSAIEHREAFTPLEREWEQGPVAATKRPDPKQALTIRPSGSGHCL